MRTRRLASYTLLVCMTVPGQTALAQKPAAKAAGHQAAAPGKQAGKKTVRKNWRWQGQHAMAAKRIRQIQAALIQEHYLQGRATGVWDVRSKTAMSRFQADNRWQSKVVPDARALIKLGLGPDHSGLMNPETAVVSFALGDQTPTSTASLHR